MEVLTPLPDNGQLVKMFMTPEPHDIVKSKFAYQFIMSLLWQWLGQKVLPQSVRPYVILSIRTYVTPNDDCSLSWIVLIIILWTLVTLLSTIRYSSRSIMVHMASCFRSYGPCLWKITIWNYVRFLIWLVLIRILWNLVTLFSTIMSSSSLIMVYIAPCFHELWSFVYENSPFEKKVNIAY